MLMVSLSKERDYWKRSVRLCSKSFRKRCFPLGKMPVMVRLFRRRHIIMVFLLL